MLLHVGNPSLPTAGCAAVTAGWPPSADPQPACQPQHWTALQVLARSVSNGPSHLPHALPDKYDERTAMCRACVLGIMATRGAAVGQQALMQACFVQGSCRRARQSQRICRRPPPRRRHSPTHALSFLRGAPQPPALPPPRWKRCTVHVADWAVLPLSPTTPARSSLHPICAAAISKPAAVRLNAVVRCTPHLHFSS